MAGTKPRGSSALEARRARARKSTPVAKPAKSPGRTKTSASPPRDDGRSTSRLKASGTRARVALVDSAMTEREVVEALPSRPPPTTAVSFLVGDKAVHPAHGVGEVISFDEREIGGQKSACYVLKILATGLKVMVPAGAVERVGLRPVMRKAEAEGIIDILRAPEVAVDMQPWNRRFRAYTEMLKSGLPAEIAKVLRDMYRLKFDKDLSFGERRLLDQARNLLVQELALAQSVEPSQIEGEIRQILST